MIKISKMTDYAVVVLAALSKDDGALMTACALSEATLLPEPTTAKVLKLLCKGEIVRSVRGASGGYQLDRSLAEISIAEIVKVIDGPIALTACLEGAKDSCDYTHCCSLKGRWGQVNEAIQTALGGVTLGDMLEGQSV